jgi:dipeptidyl aminopeptidase/acylaminoacyl peptidase
MREEGILSVEDALDIKSFPSRSQVGLSPQGTHLTYALETPNEDIPSGEARNFDFDDTGCSTEIHQSTVWVTEIETGATYQIGKPGVKCWSPEWSPDGKQVAYFSNETELAQLWVWDIETQTSRRVSDVVQRSLFNCRPRWCCDGKKILVVALKRDLTIDEANDIVVVWETNKVEKGKCTAVVYGGDNPTAPSIHNLAKDTSDLVAVDVKTGDFSVLVPLFSDSKYTLSPDGKAILYRQYKAQCIRDNHTQSLFDVVEVPIEHGGYSVLVKDLCFFSSGTFSWSPDGKRVAIGEHSMYFHGPWHIVERETGETWHVGDNEIPFSGSYEMPPLWSSDSQTVLVYRGHRFCRIEVASRSFQTIDLDPRYDAVSWIVTRSRQSCWSPRGDSWAGAFVTEKETGSIRLALVNFNTGECQILSEAGTTLARPSITCLDISADAQLLAYPVEDAQHPVDLWTYNAHTQIHRRATCVNPQLEGIPQGSSQRVEWLTAEGKLVQGALLLPPKHRSDRRYPTIVAFHPKISPSKDVDDYGVGGARGLNFTNMQLLATRGYAVFMPDVPHEGPTEMADIARVILPGIDMLIDKGITDPDRLGVIGQSEGGYGVLALIVQTNRFKAAVSSSGFCDMIADCSQSINGGIATMGWCVKDLGGSLWEYRDRYIENSPIFFFDKVEIPVLLFCGSLDPRVPPHLVEQTYACLKYLEKPVVYVRYEGESHLPSGYSRPNVRDYTNRVIAWFDRYVKNPDSSSLTTG